MEAKRKSKDDRRNGHRSRASRTSRTNRASPKAATGPGPSPPTKRSALRRARQSAAGHHRCQAFGRFAKGPDDPNSRGFYCRRVRVQPAPAQPNTATAAVDILTTPPTVAPASSAKITSAAPPTSFKSPTDALAAPLTVATTPHRVSACHPLELGRRLEVRGGTVVAKAPSKPLPRVFHDLEAPVRFDVAARQPISNKNQQQHTLLLLLLAAMCGVLLYFGAAGLQKMAHGSGFAGPVLLLAVAIAALLSLVLLQLQYPGALGAMVSGKVTSNPSPAALFTKGDRGDALDSGLPSSSEVSGRPDAPTASHRELIQR